MIAEITSLFPEGRERWEDSSPAYDITDTSPQEVLQLIWVPYYDIEVIAKLERELKNIHLDLPAKQSPDITKIFWVIEQICDWTQLSDINNFLENSAVNSKRARADMQRCWMLLQKIAWIKNQQDINWNLIFSRLELDKKQAA